jgi:hypothetical protein
MKVFSLRHGRRKYSRIAERVRYFRPRAIVIRKKGRQQGRGVKEGG